MNRDKTEKSKKNENEEYEFLIEKIKKKPFDKKKFAQRAGIIILCGIVIGFVMSITFFLSTKYLGNLFPSSTEQKVETPKIPHGQIQEEAELKAIDGNKNDKTTDLSDYKKNYTKLYDVYNQVKSSLVTVNGFSKGVDWFNEEYAGQEHQVSGVIVANANDRLYILTENSVVEGTDYITVLFSNKQEVNASFQCADPKTGLAIVTVDLDKIEEATMSEINVVKWGNSDLLREGAPVIAAGAPAGYKNSVIYGTVVSTEETILLENGNFNMIVTDIPIGKEASGVLANLDGEVVGIIVQEILAEQNNSLVSYIGVTQIDELVDLLANNKEIPYLGMTSVTVTTEISEKQDIPTGVYVKEVTLDSPAMTAGIQPGVVITRFKGESVYTEPDLLKKILDCPVGEIVEIDGKKPGPDGYTDVKFSVTIGSAK